LRPKHCLAGVTGQPKRCASSSRLCSPTAVRTGLRKPSAPIAKPALILSAHLQASMIHAAPMPGNERLWCGRVMEGHSTGLIAIRQPRRHGRAVVNPNATARPWRVIASEPLRDDCRPAWIRALLGVLETRAQREHLAVEHVDFRGGRDARNRLASLRSRSVPTTRRP